MLGVDAWIYPHGCSSEVLRVIKFFPLSPGEGTMRVEVISARSMVLSCSALPALHAVFRTCTHDSLPPACPDVIECGTPVPWEQS